MLPKRLRIGPFDYEIKALGDEARDDMQGLCDSKKQTIWIDQTMHPQHQFETLVHEAMHGLWELTGLPHDFEEAVVRKMTPLLIELFAQNDELLDLLIAHWENLQK